MGLSSIFAALLLGSLAMTAQPSRDSDHDGLTDALEQHLLLQFAPEMRVSRHDCSNIPAAFMPDTSTPIVLAEDGTIYGQVFPARTSTVERPEVEIHYYHLWRTDCGRHGHPLDTEHVAVLVRADDPDMDLATWHAEYWYAAAHEDTVCDVSQITRAKTVHAEDHGAKVWISFGKHASYLSEPLCKSGCGNDRCLQTVALHTKRIVNLGEPGAPMNGSLFIASKEWPLLAKMSASNFGNNALARLEAMPETDIALYRAGRHPAQGIVAISSHTEEHIAAAGSNTDAALGTANDHTNAALSTAKDSSGNALQKSYRKTKHGLGVAARRTGDALHMTDGPPPPK